MLVLDLEKLPPLFFFGGERILAMPCFPYIIVQPLIKISLIFSCCFLWPSSGAPPSLLHFSASFFLAPGPFATILSMLESGAKDVLFNASSLAFASASALSSASSCAYSLRRLSSLKIKTCSTQKYMLIMFCIYSIRVSPSSC